MLVVSCPPPDSSPTTLKHVVGGGELTTNIITPPLTVYWQSPTPQQKIPPYFYSIFFFYSVQWYCGSPTPRSVKFHLIFIRQFFLLSIVVLWQSHPPKCKIACDKNDKNAAFSGAGKRQTNIVVLDFLRQSKIAV